MENKVKSFGTLKDGREAHVYLLSNKNGMQVEITNYAAAIVSLRVPDKKGLLGDVVLGYDSVTGYENDEAFINVVVGRYANRIAKGHFSLNGKDYQLACNNVPNHLHGGPGGFHRALWKAEPIATEKGPALRLSHESPDGEEGFPGALEVTVTYTLTEDNALEITYRATTDQPTILNLTQHAYFNLSADPQSKILDHELKLNADRYLPTDETNIPTAEFRQVADTPFDFLDWHSIGDRIEEEDQQLQYGSGYDHCWVVNREKDNELVLAAEAWEPKSGRLMEVLTTEPGLQCYTANHLKEQKDGKAGKISGPRTAFCLETQHFPDSPNQPNFPTVELNPEEVFRSTTIYRFKTK